jgi:putative CocE/NonD family hydrolase
MPMQDGAELVADVHAPAGEGRWPVLLVRTPYGRRGSFQSQHMLNLDVLDALAAGFVVVIQDVRGRGSSDGRFEPYVDEADDARASLDWIVDQPFSNGWVGMYGASYVGVTQWQAVRSGHPALAAIAPAETVDHYRDDWTYTGGAFQLGLLTMWMMDSLAPEDIDRRERAGEDVGRLRTLLDDLVADPPAALARRPLAGGHVDELSPSYAEWLRRRDDRDYWQRRDVAHLVPALPLAGLHIVGLNDVFCDGGLAAYARATGPGAPAAERQHLILGPWSHGNFTDWQGDLWLGHSADAGTFGLGARQLEFFRASAEGRASRLPPVEYFTTGVNRWREAESWPPPGVRDTDFYLAADGGLHPAPAPEGLREFVSDPDDPVPTVGGATFLPGIFVGKNSGPKDQRPVEQRSDVLVFTSAPLDADLEVAGSVSAELWGACEQASCDWTVRICDVDPSGVSLGIVDGIQRSCSPEPAERARLGAVAVRVGAISHVFPAGHRVRVQVAGSNFPRFDRNPHSTSDVASARVDEYVPARQVLGVGGIHASRISLPVVRDGERTPL